MIWTHVSELAIDRMLAGELSAGEASAVRDHATRCGACAALLDDADAARRTFAAAPRPIWMPVRRRRFAPALLGGLGAMAAALALVVVWPRGGDAVRTKGTAIVGFFVAHGDQVRRGSPTETVAPGDRIELYTTTLEPTWFAAISDDASGARSIYVEPQLVVAGREQVLPVAIELDAAPGSERVTGVFCPTRFEPLSIDLSTPPAGCTIDRFTLVKGPR
jgi:hypothetical protein